MLFDEKAVRENLRNRDGKRVFYLRSGDTLTPSARDWLGRERIPILSAKDAKPERWRVPGGNFREEKGEGYTCLAGDLLVLKTHPRIRFRGAMDSLEAELLLAGPETRELLDLARKLIRCEVLEEPVGEVSLYGLSEAQQRQHSHFPQDHYGIPHFMPDYADGERVLILNRCRTAARAAELAAAEAFTDSEGNLIREDIVRALNRMSSMIYILMLREKAKKN
jgi:ethanolamine utilization cobalamin adenosyltransferase